MELTENKNTSQNIFDSLSILVLLMRFKWLIMLFVIVVTGITAYLAFQIPNLYTATVNAVPPKTSGSAFESMMGNISSALKDFGLSKIGGKSEGSYSFLVVLDSRTVKDSIIKQFDLSKVYNIPSSKMSLVRKQLEDYLNITVEMEGNYTISVTDRDPKRAADIANAYVSISNAVSQKIFHNESRINKQYLEDRLTGINRALTDISNALQLYSSKNMVFSPQDQAKSVTTALGELRAEIMKQEIAEQMLINKFGVNDPYTQQQRFVIEELKKKLSSATKEPGFAGNFPLSEAAKVGMDYMKLYTEFEAYSKVKAFLLPMLEEAKLNEYRMTETIFIIDKAIPPDKKSEPKRSVILSGGFLGSIAFSLIFVVLMDALKTLSKNYRIRKAELSKK